MTTSPELAILRHLSDRSYASAAGIGTACAMNAAKVRARLVMLESMRMVSGRRDPDGGPQKPQRVYVITGEGRRKASRQLQKVET